MLFIGNKCDLDHDRVVSKEHGKSVADELGGGRIGHHETSAKSNINVTEVYGGGKKSFSFTFESNSIIPPCHRIHTIHISHFHFFQIFQDIIRVIKVEDANKGRSGNNTNRKKRCTII